MHTLIEAVSVFPHPEGTVNGANVNRSKQVGMTDCVLIDLKECLFPLDSYLAVRHGMFQTFDIIRYVRIVIMLPPPTNTHTHTHTHTQKC
jgi:hypothetical protein